MSDEEFLQTGQTGPSCGSGKGTGAKNLRKWILGGIRFCGTDLRNSIGIQAALASQTSLGDSIETESLGHGKNGYVVYGDPRKRLEVEIQKKLFDQCLGIYSFFPTPLGFLQVEPVADALPGPLFGGRRLGKRQGLADMGQHWDIMGRTKKGSMAISQRAMTPGKYRCCEIGC